MSSSVNQSVNVPIEAPADPGAEPKPAWVLRLPALGVFLLSSAVMLTAFMLHPSERGVGTHTALGLPPCGLEQTMGVPCATCGMTTSFSYAAHGQLITSFINQPAGAILAVLTAMAAVLSGYALVTGMSLTPIFISVWRPRTFVIGGTVVIAAWIYKIVIHMGLIGVGG